MRTSPERTMGRSRGARDRHRRRADGTTGRRHAPSPTDESARARWQTRLVPTPIDGFCAPGYTPVREAFEANFAERGEVGAAVHVIVAGEVVVDLVGGWADEDRTRPWRHDTIVDIYSVGKAVLSLLALQLVDAGELALDQPIAEAWPEFATGGKAGATVSHTLSHRAGMPAIRELLTNEDLFDWERMTAALAATDTWWVPGERLLYHTNTFGHLVGELIHRASGVMPGDRRGRSPSHSAPTCGSGFRPPTRPGAPTSCGRRTGRCRSSTRSTVSKATS